MNRVLKLEEVFTAKRWISWNHFKKTKSRYTLIIISAEKNNACHWKKIRKTRRCELVLLFFVGKQNLSRQRLKLYNTWVIPIKKTSKCFVFQSLVVSLSFELKIWFSFQHFSPMFVFHQNWLVFVNRSRDRGGGLVRCRWLKWRNGMRNWKKYSTCDKECYFQNNIM